MVLRIWRRMSFSKIHRWRAVHLYQQSGFSDGSHQAALDDFTADRRPAPARERHFGLVRQLAGQALTATATLGEKSAGRPVRERSSKPCSRPRKKHLRHLLTIWRSVPMWATLLSLSMPLAAYATILARMTSRYGDAYFQALASSRARSASDRTIWALSSPHHSRTARCGICSPRVAYFGEAETVLDDGLVAYRRVLCS